MNEVSLSEIRLQVMKYSLKSLALSPLDSAESSQFARTEYCAVVQCRVDKVFIVSAFCCCYFWCLATPSAGNGSCKWHASLLSDR